MKDAVVFMIDRESFPVYCDELESFMDLMDGAGFSLDIYANENPTGVFKHCLELCDDWDLVIPVTRNVFVRDRLRQEGVNFVLCL